MSARFNQDVLDSFKKIIRWCHAEVLLQEPVNCLYFSQQLELNWNVAVLHARGQPKLITATEASFSTAPGLWTEFSRMKTEPGEYFVHKSTYIPWNIIIAKPFNTSGAFTLCFYMLNMFLRKYEVISWLPITHVGSVYCGRFPDVIKRKPLEVEGLDLKPSRPCMVKKKGV